MSLLLPIFLVLSFQEEPRLLRVTYEVEFGYGEENVTAQLALNHLDSEHFSLHCRKTPAGTLFTYWATPGVDALRLPKRNRMFEGPAGSLIQLFPESPALKRDSWLSLLMGRCPEDLGRWKFNKEGDWFVLRYDENGAQLRWRETKRDYKDSWNDAVFEPKYYGNDHLVPIQRLADYWREDEP